MQSKLSPLLGAVKEKEERGVILHDFSLELFGNGFYNGIEGFWIRVS